MNTIQSLNPVVIKGEPGRSTRKIFLLAIFGLFLIITLSIVMFVTAGMRDADNTPVVVHSQTSYLDNILARRYEETALKDIKPGSGSKYLDNILARRYEETALKQIHSSNSASYLDNILARRYEETALKDIKPGAGSQYLDNILARRYEKTALKDHQTNP